MTTTGRKTNGRQGPEIDRKAVKQLRLLRMLSQRDLATAAGVSSSQVSRIESGSRRWPHPATTGALAKALGVKPETLCKRPADKAALARADELLALANAGLDDTHSWDEGE